MNLEVTEFKPWVESHRMKTHAYRKIKPVETKGKRIAKKGISQIQYDRLCKKDAVIINGYVYTKTKYAIVEE